MAKNKFYRGIRFFCFVCLSLATLGLGASLVVPLFSGASLSFSRPEVSLTDVQGEVSKGADIRKKIEELRDQFPNFDDERWGQARDLIRSWVDELGATTNEKGKFLADIRAVTEKFSPDQRTQAIDAYYRLKKEKLLNERSTQSWFTQFEVLNTLFFCLFLVGLFMAVLMLVEIARHLELRKIDSS